MSDLAAASERHYYVAGPNEWDGSIDYCHECGTQWDWPCDAALFRDALDMMTIRANGMEHARDAARALADELAEALQTAALDAHRDGSTRWHHPPGPRFKEGAYEECVDVDCTAARAALAQWEASK